jgi:hypothetical protein
MSHTEKQRDAAEFRLVIIRATYVKGAAGPLFFVKV